MRIFLKQRLPNTRRKHLCSIMNRSTCRLLSRGKEIIQKERRKGISLTYLSMRSKFFVSVVVLAALLAAVTPAFADDTIVIKRALPEFRDISVWKGRTGLTLF